MGGFYTNYTFRGTGQREVADALAGRRTLIAPQRNGCVVAFDEKSDNQDQRLIAALASRLSRELACTVLVVLNHDDDILWYQLHVNGKLADEYDSSPGYFDPSAKPSAPIGGDAKQLCAAFDCSDAALVERVLRKSFNDPDRYVFARDRHADLARALALPDFVVGVAYASFGRGEYPLGLSPTEMLRATGAPAPPTQEEIQRSRDLDFYDRLGAEDPSRPCKREGCDRGSIRQGVLCKRHHFEMIKRRDCPFDH